MGNVQQEIEACRKAGQELDELIEHGERLLDKVSCDDLPKMKAIDALVKISNRMHDLKVYRSKFEASWGSEMARLKNLGMMIRNKYMGGKNNGE